MIVILSDDKKSASTINIDDVDKYESLGIKMYNYLDDGTITLWFDGKKWLFPKPVRVVQQSTNNKTSELLEKISNQLDELIRSNNE